MTSRKPFIAPIWLLVVVIGAQALLLYYMISVQIAWRALDEKTRLMTNDQFPSPTPLSFVPHIIETVILTLVMIAECFVLWRLRKKKYLKALAWAHVILLFLALVVLPFWALAEAQFKYLIDSHILLYWILIGLAYMLLLLILFQAYFRQPVFVPANTDNILDDYAE